MWADFIWGIKSDLVPVFSIYLQILTAQYKLETLKGIQKCGQLNWSFSHMYVKLVNVAIIQKPPSTEKNRKIQK